MTLDVDVTATVGDFRVAAAFRSEGHVTALFGRSGAGKTTLVNLIAGLETPDRGRIAVDDIVLIDTERRITIPTHRRRVGYVFQDARLFPHLSVRGNLTYGRRFTRRDDRWADFDAIVDMLGIAHLLDRRPAGLSGGEKQRVALGRALVASPRLLLMDEPFAALDETRKAELMPYIERLRDTMRLPIVYVSHAIDEVARLADTMVVLDDGRVVADGALNAILGRADLYPYIGQHEASVVLDLTVGAPGDDPDVTILDHPAGRLTVPRLDKPPGAQVRLRVLGRDVALALGDPGPISIRNRLSATVTGIAPGRPPMLDVTLDARGMPLVAGVTREAADALELRPGLPVTALIKSAALDRTSGSGSNT
ncbi:molybdenum ABC transporter ATP-binding protein [Bauldia sp.]|uniref:molybdenum ABC transporter ATP-binding protein n=1 Tax=Bauldia sp. TaxID=2575872 RepID=UPI003BA934E2